MLIAPYKAGKTTLISNLLRSLVDGEPFLPARATENRPAATRFILRARVYSNFNQRQAPPYGAVEPEVACLRRTMAASSWCTSRVTYCRCARPSGPGAVRPRSGSLPWRSLSRSSRRRQPKQCWRLRTFATHHLVMTTLARATAPGQTDEVLDRHVARASRLMQLFCMQTTRRNTPCQCPAMRNRRRCRLHGGPSTGPRTPEGLARSRRARWKHGEYSREARDARRIAQRQWREIWALLTPIHPAIPR